MKRQGTPYFIKKQGAKEAETWPTKPLNVAIISQPACITQSPDTCQACPPAIFLCKYGTLRTHITLNKSQMYEDQTYSRHTPSVHMQRVS